MVLIHAICTSALCKKKHVVTSLPIKTYCFAVWYYLFSRNSAFNCIRWISISFLYIFQHQKSWCGAYFHSLGFFLTNLIISLNLTKRKKEISESSSFLRRCPHNALLSCSVCSSLKSIIRNIILNNCSFSKYIDTEMYYISNENPVPNSCFFFLV